MALEETSPVSFEEKIHIVTKLFVDDENIFEGRRGAC